MLRFPLHRHLHDRSVPGSPTTSLMQPGPPPALRRCPGSQAPALQLQLSRQLLSSSLNPLASQPDPHTQSTVQALGVPVQAPLCHVLGLCWCALPGAPGRARSIVQGSQMHPMMHLTYVQHRCALPLPSSTSSTFVSCMCAPIAPHAMVHVSNKLIIENASMLHGSIVKNIVQGSLRLRS